MAERKRSYVWSYFTSINSNDAVCDTCNKTVRYCGNTTNLIKHLHINHKTEYDNVMTRRSEEEERRGTGAARARQTSLSESFGAAGRQYPGTD